MALSNNNRTYYATHAVALGKKDADPTAAITNAASQANTIRAASGVQSVGVNTTFNLEQVFQLGQLEIYENIENIPDVEVTIEKALDGHALIQHLATPQASATTLASRYNNNRTDIRIAYVADTLENVAGTPQAELYCSGMYLSSISLTLPVDGNCTESVTFVGNDKTWSTGTALDTGEKGSWWNQTLNRDEFSADGTPTNAAGVLRRQDVELSGSIVPKDLAGAMGINAAEIRATGDVYKCGHSDHAANSTGFVPQLKFGTPASGPLFGASTVSAMGFAASGANNTIADKKVAAVHVQSITISTDLGRTELFELGRRGPYHRFADFPTEVTCAFEIIETEIGDIKNVDAEAESNVTDSPIFIMLKDGTLINLGAKNKLASVTSSGGDTGGGNRTATFNYSNFNSYQVHHPLDPANLAGGVTYGNFSDA